MMNSDISNASASDLTERTDYPIYVVCVDDGAQRAGCVAGFVTQCSIDPVRFLVCISKMNHTFEVARNAAHLSLHLLGSDQHDLATLFDHLTSDTCDKFNRCAWDPGRTGVPVLRQCRAWAEGKILDQRDVGDHVAFLMAPVAGGKSTEKGQLTAKEVKDITAGHALGSGSGPSQQNGEAQLGNEDRHGS